MKFLKKSLLGLLILIYACNGNSKEEADVKNDSTKIEASSDSIGKEAEGRRFEKISYPNGKVKMEGNIENGLREGKWVSFYENGMIWSETNFEKGIKNGHTTSYYPNGTKRYEGEYKNGKESGKWIYYDESGKVSSEKEFK